MCNVQQTSWNLLKSKHPKSGKRRNRNKWWFGFWHFSISDVLPLWNMPNLSEIRILSIRALRPNCPKSEINTSKIWTKLFGFWTIMFRFWTCPESGQFCPICTVSSSYFRRSKCLKSEQKCWHFGFPPITEMSENGTKVNRPRTKLVEILDVDCIYKMV